MLIVAAAVPVMVALSAKIALPSAVMGTALSQKCIEKGC